MQSRARVEFPAMGSRFRVLAADRVDLTFAEPLVDSFEARWSRFIDESELSALPADTWTDVHPATFGLLEACAGAYNRTAGRFDATCGGTLHRLGYVGSRRAESGGTGGWAGVGLDHRTRRVRRPAEVTIDVGGIAKGYTADVIARRCIRLGARGVLVDAGGDIRAAGSVPWTVGVELPGLGGRSLSVRMCQGAIATSSREVRRWMTDDGPRHHIVDSRTGDSAQSDVSSAAVWAPNATAAEVSATVLVASGTPALVGYPDALALDVSGRLHGTGLFRNAA